MAVSISKTDLRNIILQLGNYISLGGEVTAPTDTSYRNKIRMATVLKRKLEKIIIIRIKHHERFIHLIHIILRSYRGADR